MNKIVAIYYIENFPAILKSSGKSRTYSTFVFVDKKI